MSANSPRHATRSVPNVVPPQAVTDRSIIDSVAGFINDVALANTPQGDTKDAILWSKFETTADITDLCYGDDWDVEGRVAPPLLLILGYATGIQVWAIPANGEATEVLSWRHGSVKSLRILPTPIISNCELADETIDQFSHKRPLMAICDSSSGTNNSTNQPYCSINYISLKNGEQVKSIKFKNPVIDILANRSSIVVTFAERIAVFDARTLEDRLTITTCHPSPGLNPNPVALGPRWLAYAERKLLPNKRSSGGCDYDGVSSYTATVINAAKSLGKGLRELGETVAAGLTGNSGHGHQNHGLNLTGNCSGLNSEKRQPGVITILDIKYPIKETSQQNSPLSPTPDESLIAHFVAHSDAIVALTFDFSGMLLLTADKRGHDFHVFRIHAHPGGITMSAVHHLYVLHRGDTTAKVQDMSFSLDSRWVSVSSIRGTTHVFPVTPYGGPAGVRTHGSSHVVNRLSRFHRSAGLSIDGRSSSPVSYSENSHSQCVQSAFPNPRTPPYPHPTVVLPLAQLRQPINTGNTTGSGQMSFSKSGNGRQRVSSLSEDLSQPLRVSTTFARPRAWLLETAGITRESPAIKLQGKPVDSLFVMTGHGSLIQYDLDPKPAACVPKEKVSDETSIELYVEAKAQWLLVRHDDSTEIQPPLPSDSWLLKDRLSDEALYTENQIERNDDRDDVWLSQVEIITHAGPHRRLWMGPQFMFKTYNTPSGGQLSLIEVESVEIGVGNPGNRPARTNPMNMPPAAAQRSSVSVLIESSSYSSVEQSPRMSHFQFENSDTFGLGSGETQLREDLADAMKESPGGALIDAGSIKIATIAAGTSSTTSSTSSRSSVVGYAKVVNPLGTVTTVMTDSSDTNSAEYQEAEIISRDQYVHENCDESLFRPVVTLFSRGDIDGKDNNSDIIENIEQPIGMGSELIVPVMEEKIIPKKIDDEIVIKNKSKNEKKSKSVKTVKEPVKPIKEPVKLVMETIHFIEQDDLPIQPVFSDISQEPFTSIITVNEPVIDEFILTKKLKEASKKIKEKLPEPVVIDEIILNKKSIKKTKEKTPGLNDSDFDEPIRKVKEKSPVVEEPIKKIKKTKETFEESIIKIEEPIIKEPEVSVTIKLKKKSQQKEEFKPKPKERTKLSKKIDDDFVTIPRLEKKDFAIIDIEDEDEIQPIKSFSDMFKASEHFTIQDNLTKNSDFILKTNKLEKRRDSDFTVIEPEDELVKHQSKEQEQFFDTSASKFDLDFTENLFSNPLPPLESFVDSLDQLNFQEDSELMNFQSPAQDDEKDEIVVKTKIMKYDETNLIFADCTSLHGEDFGDMNLAIGGRDNNSSDDTEDSNSSNEKKIEEDDDELRVLIGTAATDTNNVKNILEALPDNNQKDIKQQSTNANSNNKKKTKKKKR